MITFFILECEDEFEYDKEYEGGDVVQTDETCDSVCKGREDCKSWTWNGDQKKCRIQTSLGETKTKTGSISGKKNDCKLSK